MKYVLVQCSPSSGFGQLASVAINRMTLFKKDVLVVWFVNLLWTYSDSHFELVRNGNEGNVQLVGNQTDCRGHTINSIYKVECSAVCFDYMSSIWNTKGSTRLDSYPDCEWFTYEEGITTSDGSCTVCFPGSQLPVVFQLNRITTNSAYALTSVLCKFTFN